MNKKLFITCIMFFVCVFINAQSNNDENKKLRNPSYPPNCCHNIVGKQKQSGNPNNSNDLIVGVNTNVGGAIPLGNLSPSTPSINVEFTNGKFNSEINIIYSLNFQSVSSSWGIGAMSIFNYILDIPFGLIYLGGGAGYIFNMTKENNIHDLKFGANINYRYPFSSGMYVRIGSFVGGKLSFIDDENDFNFFLRPDIGIGYSF